MIPVLLPGASREGLDLPDFLTAATWVEFAGSLDDADAFHRLVCGIRGIEPGPGPTNAAAGSADAADAPKIPDIWTVPHQRNPNFTGRGEILGTLQASLSSGEPAAVTQAIAGLGGVGKTQLVIEYAYRHADQYDAVLWVGDGDAGQRSGVVA